MQGNEVERNDDSGGSLASHVIWTAPATDTYTVQVWDYSDTNNIPSAPVGEGGTFTLLVETVGGGTDAGGSDPCSGGLTLTDESDTISFDDTGIRGGVCDWIIRCDHGDGITFTFESLSVERNFDYVTLYDGDFPEEDMQVDGAHLTGTITNHTRFMTTGRTLLIEYTSDGSVNRGGFEGTYTCGIADIVGASHRVSVNGGALDGEIVNGGDELDYEFDAEGGVEYELEVELGTLSDSVLEIYAPDGSSLLAMNDDGGEGRGLASYILWEAPETGTFFIRVRGYSDRNTGTFSLTVTSDADGGTLADPCEEGLELNVEGAEITFMPRGQYEDNVNCRWAITCPVRGEVPEFTFSALDTEQGWDFVNVYDGDDVADDANLLTSVSGSLQNLDRASYEAGSQSMTIQFTSDGSVTNAGFAGSYSCSAPHGPTCEDVLEELNGAGACAQFIQRGDSCQAMFCPTCTFDHMCDNTCGFCAGEDVGGPTPPREGENCFDFAMRNGRTRQGCVTAVVDTVAVDGPAADWTTYALTAVLPTGAHNLYSIYGAPASGSRGATTLHIPAAWQAPSGGGGAGTNIGGVNAALFAIYPEAEFDSWLTVGVVDGSNGPTAVGLDFTGWDQSTPLSTDNGALIWTNPDDGPVNSDDQNGGVQVAQLTTPTGQIWEATMGLQGRSTYGDDDYEIQTLRFSSENARQH
eukprot:SAG11_NODE_25_length_23789_cov_23.813592_6_plen_693_part_00